LNSCDLHDMKCMWVCCLSDGLEKIAALISETCVAYHLIRMYVEKVDAAVTS
jgi:hypothetical protein